MSLVAGTKLGPYEILAPLGAGGMGEVYRARDTKLGREVALKVLPQTFAADADRMARFQREAQVLASLNHPNIAAIYGLEDSGGVRALVMELIEGPTLAERIGEGVHGARLSGRTSAGGRTSGSAGERRSPVQLDDALHIAKQIAEALEAAHERGVIHRDLKPANIKVTLEGTVKILDFGLAKAVVAESAANDISKSPTLTFAATHAGMILGTASYMSPEQAKGKPVDRRADIWAFGCVLYEALTGIQAFAGETTSDILAAVIRAEPDWHALPAPTPRRIHELVRRCLVKDPKQRLQAIGDARIAIEENLAGAEDVEAALPRQQTGGGVKPSLRPAPAWIAAMSVMVLVSLVVGWWAGARRTHPSPNWSAEMLGGPTVALGPRISPDGHTLAFQAMVDGLTQVAVMDTDSGDWTVLTKNRSRGYVTELNWSPDGSEIYFDREFSVPQGIYIISRFGGDERLVLEDAFGPEVLPDGSLVLARLNKDRNFQLHRFWPDTGRLEALDAFFPLSMDLCPDVRAFRDGKDAVFFGKTLEQEKADPSPHLYVIDLTTGKSRRLAPDLNLGPTSSVGIFPLAVAGDDLSVLVDLKAGDLHRIVAIPRNGTGPNRTLLSLSLPPWLMSTDKQGNIYLDQADRPIEILRFSVSGGAPDVLAGSESVTNGQIVTVELPDGRVVFGSSVAGRSRLLVVRPGGEAIPFIETKEETSAPACLVGRDEVAFMLGPSTNRVVAVASVADGQIVRRLGGLPGGDITGLAASRDGKTVYYVASRAVWATPATGGLPRRITRGDSIAIDPTGTDLIVQFSEEQGFRLVRVPVSGGEKQQPIPFQSALRLTPHTLGPTAIGKGGRVLLSIASPDSWFYGAGILDPKTGKVDKVPLSFTGDLVAPGWQDDGRILSSAWPLKATIWRFRPVASDNK